MRYQRLVIALLVRIVSLQLISLGCEDKISSDKIILKAGNFLRETSNEG